MIQGVCVCILFFCFFQFAYKHIGISATIIGFRMEKKPVLIVWSCKNERGTARIHRFDLAVSDFEFLVSELDNSLCWLVDLAHVGVVVIFFRSSQRWNEFFSVTSNFVRRFFELIFNAHTSPHLEPSADRFDVCLFYHNHKYAMCVCVCECAMYGVYFFLIFSYMTRFEARTLDPISRSAISRSLARYVWFACNFLFILFRFFPSLCRFVFNFSANGSFISNKLETGIGVSIYIYIWKSSERRHYM